ncbi:MAG: hypothetical protein HY660_07015 [Armatimonadetes bacterium]|nr:hypothetical protein [Armatimonadota bacterium]
MARAIEEGGIPTVIVMMWKDVEEALRPPRVVHVRFPFGRPLGEPGNIPQQRVIIADALRFLEKAEEPGSMLELPYRWRREDYAEILTGRKSDDPATGEAAGSAADRSSRFLSG